MYDYFFFSALQLKRDSLGSPTQRFFAFLCVGLLLATRLASAQQCPAGPADTIPNGGVGSDSGGALRWTVPQVRGTLLDVLRNLKYQIVEPVSDTGAIETKPSYRFPDDPVARTFRHYKHPGIVVRAYVRPEGDSSRLFLFFRAICRVAEAPPPGYAVPVETSLEVLAEDELTSAMFLRLLREYPAHYPSCANTPSPDTAVFEVSQLSQPQFLISGPTLEYPDSLRRQGKSGRVVYSVIINKDGRVDVRSVTVEHRDEVEFEWAARRWLEGARFSPGCLNGQAVRVRRSVPIDFKVRR